MLTNACYNTLWFPLHERYVARLTQEILAKQWLKNKSDFAVSEECLW